MQPEGQGVQGMPTSNKDSSHPGQTVSRHRSPGNNRPERMGGESYTGLLFCPGCGQVIAEAGHDVRCRRCGFRWCPGCSDA